MPCLSAIGGALSPDYSYSINQQESLDYERERAEMTRSYEPNPADTTKFDEKRKFCESKILFGFFSVNLAQEFEDVVRSYAECVHDQWSYAKVKRKKNLDKVFSIFSFFFFQSSNKVGLSANKSTTNIGNIQIFVRTKLSTEKFERFSSVFGAVKNFGFSSFQDASKLEDPIREALKAVEKLQFHLEKNDTGVTRIATKPLQRKKQKVRWKLFFSSKRKFHFFFKDKTAPDYLPKAVDFTSVTMNRDMQVRIFVSRSEEKLQRKFFVFFQDLSEALAQNAHEVWAKQLKSRLAAIGKWMISLKNCFVNLFRSGGGLHSRLVPYELLTEKEKQKDLKFYQDFVKYLNTMGYRVNK